MAHSRIRATSVPAHTPKVSAALQSVPAHYGASRSKDLAAWNPQSGSADADLLADLDTLRARSRDLTRNHGIASGAAQTTLDNVVGTGPRLSAIPDYRALGQSKEWAENFADLAEGLFREYWETTEIDAAGCLTGASATTQIYRGRFLNGEALSIPLWLPRNGSRWATRHQIIESDRLSNPIGRQDGDKVPGGELRGGVEVDAYGRPIAYYIRKSHPGDTVGFFLGSADDWERIPAETPWGRARVIHVHDKERQGQTRGKPALSAVLAQFKMLDHYQRTEMQAAVANAMIAAVFETPLDAAALTEIMGGVSDPNDDRLQAYMQFQRENIAPMRGGAVIAAPPGSKLAPFVPSRPSDAFAPFIEAVCRHIGAGIGLPLELLLKDFSKTNYSSARAALLEAWRYFLGGRKWLETYWLRPVYLLWLEEAVNAGLIQAPNFYDYRYAYSRCKWLWPGRGWIDPLKEAEAAQLRIDAGLSTREQECAEQGLDWKEVMDQAERERAYEMAAEERLGAPLFRLGKPEAAPAEEKETEQEAA